MSGVRWSAFQTFPVFSSQAFEEKERERVREKGKKEMF